jgi:TonB family protein
MKSSGLFQLDQIARNTVEQRPFWLESDQQYDIQFHYDPNWERGEYGSAESRASIASQNLPELPQELNSQPVAPPVRQERLLVGPPEVQQGPSMIRGHVPRGSSFNIGQYQTDAVAKVHRFYHPPKGFENAQVMAQFTVLPNGDIIDLRIMRSSTIPPVDNALLQAVRSAAPFASHPLRNYPIIVRMGKRQPTQVSAEVKEYTRQLRAHINPNWYPPVALGERRVLVQFTVDELGKPYNVHILSSSGDLSIDASAKTAVTVASNLPPLPPSMRGRQNNFVWIFDKHTREL